MTAPPPHLFLDASVLLAASGSPTGGSSAVLQVAKKFSYPLLVTKLVLQEAERNTVKVSTDALARLYTILTEYSLIVVDPPSADEIQKVPSVVASKDAHVVAAAHKGEATILLTLDAKHLLNDVVRVAVKPLQVLTPGEWLSSLPER